MKKRRHFWVARESRGRATYVVSAIQLRRRMWHRFCSGDILWHDKHDTHSHLCAKVFEAATGINLKPGEGPVKVRIKGLEVLK